jgi:Calcium/calmodulin dependent protein kinase II Association.
MEAIMILSLKTFTTVCILSIALIQEPVGKPKESADIKELMRLEQVWNEAHLQGNTEPLNRLWADDLVITVTNMPLMTKTEALGFMRSGKMKFQRYETSDIRIRVYREAAIVTGRLERSRSLNGQEMNDNWRFTKAYIRQGGRWQVVAFHSSTSSQ